MQHKFCVHSKKCFRPFFYLSINFQQRMLKCLRTCGNPEKIVTEHKKNLFKKLHTHACIQTKAFMLFKHRKIGLDSCVVSKRFGIHQRLSSKF